MVDSVTLRLEGIDELKRALKDAPRKIRERAVRQGLRKGALAIRNEAKRLAPVLKPFSPSKYRKAGTIKRRLSVRPSKFARQRGDEGVFVGVKPLRGRTDTRKFGKAGAKNPNDPFYWWWQEFGWVPRGPGRRFRGGARMRASQREASAGSRVPGKFFLTRAAKAKGEEAIRIFLRETVPAIEKLNRKAL